MQLHRGVRIADAGLPAADIKKRACGNAIHRSGLLKYKQMAMRNKESFARLVSPGSVRAALRRGRTKRFAVARFAKLDCPICQDRQPSAGYPDHGDSYENLPIFFVDIL
jgi:hypothetical protein